MREALLAVESSGRAAMAELRNLLGLLAPGSGSATGPGDLDPLHPVPGLGDLPGLIDRVAAAGLPVRLHTSGPPQELSPGASLAAYRVVQEGLTNVLKHTDLAPTAVRLDYRPGELVIEISDAGRPSGDGVPAGPALGAARRPGCPARARGPAGAARHVRRGAGRRPAPVRRVADDGADTPSCGHPGGPVIPARRRAAHPVSP